MTPHGLRAASIANERSGTDSDVPDPTRGLPVRASGRRSLRFPSLLLTAGSDRLRCSQQVTRGAFGSL